MARLGTDIDSRVVMTSPKKGFCRLKFCTNVTKSGTRGLCVYHYNFLTANHRDRLDEFAEPLRFGPLSERVYKIDKSVTDVCWLLEDSVPCTKRPHSRNLCKYHFDTLNRMGTLSKYAGKSQKAKKIYRYLAKNLRLKGICAISQNGEACSNKISARGLCGKHLKAIVDRGHPVIGKLSDIKP